MVEKLKIAIFFIPNAPLRGPCHDSAIRFGTKILELCGYLTAKEVLTICLLVSTEHTNVAKTQTDRRTDRVTPHDSIGRTYAQHRAAIKPGCRISHYMLVVVAAYMERIYIYSNRPVIAQFTHTHDSRVKNSSLQCQNYTRLLSKCGGFRFPTKFKLTYIPIGFSVVIAALSVVDDFVVLYETSRSTSRISNLIIVKVDTHITTVIHIVRHI